ncbi:MAG TPA: hypothetical protein VMV10_10990 [Pirellulales bacterium]|nr:hypothetical protein [Pirellulales bacterium]
MPYPAAAVVPCIGVPAFFGYPHRYATDEQWQSYEEKSEQRQRFFADYAIFQTEFELVHISKV